MLLESLLKLRSEDSRLWPAGRNVYQALVKEKVLPARGELRPHLAKRQAASFRRHLAILSGNSRARERSRENQAANHVRHMVIMTEKGGIALGPKQRRDWPQMNADKRG